MRKIIALATGAILLGGLAATTTSAEARPGYRHYGGHGYHGGYRRHYGGYRHGYRRRGNAGAAAALGIAGALIGGAIAAQQPRHYGPGYGYGYRGYGGPGYYGY